MPGPPPTKYTDEFLKKARAYPNTYTSQIPSIVGLAQACGVKRKTLYEWKGQEGKEELSDILDDVLEKQEAALLDSGLSGAFNSTITKLILTKHGYSDRVDTDLNIMTQDKAEQILKENGIDPGSIR